MAWTSDDLRRLTSDPDSLFGGFYIAWRKFPQLSAKQALLMSAMGHPYLNPNHSISRAAKLLGVSPPNSLKMLRRIRLKLEKPPQ